MQQSVPLNQFSLNVIHTWKLVNRPREYTAWLRQKYGEMVSISANNIKLIVLLTPEGARQVFSGDPDGYEAFWKAGFTGVAGPGSLWVLERDRHRQERKLLSPAFHPRNFDGYGVLIREITRQYTKSWQPGQTLRAIDV